jgi:hypothetical protein
MGDIPLEKRHHRGCLTRAWVLPNLLTGGGSKGNNGIVMSHATTHRFGQTGDIYEYPSPRTMLTLQMITLSSTMEENRVNSETKE